MIGYKLVNPVVNVLTGETRYYSCSCVAPYSMVQYELNKVAVPIVTGTPLFMVSNLSAIDLYPKAHYFVCEFNEEDLYPVQCVRLTSMFDIQYWMTQEILGKMWDALIENPFLDEVEVDGRSVATRANLDGTVLVRRCVPIELLVTSEKLV